MMNQKIKRGLKYITRAIHQYQPQEIFVGFSGGTDSLLCADLVMKYLPSMWGEPPRNRINRFDRKSEYREPKIFHANTGIGLKKTREYVRGYCDKRGWELVEIFAKEDCGQDYEQLVMEYGFPGPAMHSIMYRLLKERCTEELHRRYKRKRGNKIMLITGIRNDESNTRAGYKNSIIKKVGGVVWVNAWYWFTQQDKYDYITKHNLEINPVHKVIGMSGECLCGAFAHKGELDLIRLVEPETVDYIEELQEKVMQKWPWGWEDEMPEWFKALKMGQTDAFYNWEKSDYFQPMCVSCGKKYADLSDIEKFKLDKKDKEAISKPMKR